MRKALFFITVFTFSLGGGFAQEIEIIPRASWGANSQYNNLEGEYWKQILENRRQNTLQSSLGENELKKIREKNKAINNYLHENFSEQFETSDKKLHNKNTGEKYAWPLTYTDYIDSIIVHHTHSEYADSLKGMKDIHRFHSINRQWGDIGYNYIIGYNGEIFEGREGEDYTVGAHSKYNNMGSVGIAVMGNYESEGLNTQQYNSLENLIQYLTKKYGIDLSQKRYYHMDCHQDACDNFYIETYLDSVLVGHRDTGHTSCPGEKLYEQIQKIRENNLEFTKGFIPLKRGKKTNAQNNSTHYTSSDIQKILALLKNYSQEDKHKILTAINTRLDNNKNSETYKNKLKIIKLALLLSLGK